MTEIGMTHLTSLLGRVFLLASQSATSKWNGLKENNGKNDYDLLDDYISYEEGDLTSFLKSNQFMYYIYFCMSNRLELFEIENGFIICDGLYFNKPLDYSNGLHFGDTEIFNFQLKIEAGGLYVYDAALDGESVIVENQERRNDRVLLNLKEGIYSICKVEAKISVEAEEVVLKGIRLSR
jgi:hypothetical protein